MSVDSSVQSFRLAGRDLFNGYFRVDAPWENDGWSLEARFSRVEAALFEQLVAAPLGSNLAPYGELQDRLCVVLRYGGFAPLMLNREIDSGYWDAKPDELTSDAKLLFIRFFDWDLLSVRDNQYVRVRVASWPSHVEAEGRDALVEAKHVSFVGA